MSTLAQLQRDFQRHVLDGDLRIARHVDATAEVPAHVRLAIYADAYRLRLIEALGANMPRLQQLLGDEDFAQVARAYIETHPSRFASVRWFGDRLAAHLARTHASHPWLAELARWEWAIAAAFDARDATPVGLEALAAIAPDRWAGIQFELHPSVRQLSLRTNAPMLFKALSESEQPPQPAAMGQEQSWLIWRKDLKTQYRSVEPGEAAALRIVGTGGTFAQLCEGLCEWHQEDAVPAQAAGMLKRWVLEGIVTGVTEIT